MLNELREEMGDYKNYLYFLNIINNFKKTKEIYWSLNYDEEKHQLLILWEKEFNKVWPKIKPFLRKTGFQTVLFEPRYYENRLNYLRKLRKDEDYQMEMSIFECELCDTIPLTQVLKNHESFVTHRYKAWLFDTLELLKLNRHCESINNAISEMEKIKENSSPLLTYDLPK